MNYTHTIGEVKLSDADQREIFHVKGLGWYSLTNNGLHGPYSNWLVCRIVTSWQVDFLPRKTQVLT